MNPLQKNYYNIPVLTTDCVSLHVEVEGKGLPCLYVHGGPGSGSYWVRKFAGEMLESHFLMVYIDQRGACRSASPKGGNYSMDRMVQDFEEVRKSLGINHWLTMGHSFGGLLQMGYVQRFPQSILGMMLINPSLCMNDTFRQGYCPHACELLGIPDSAPCTDEITPVLDYWSMLISKLKEADLLWKMGYDVRENEQRINSTFGEVPNFNWDFEAMLSFPDYWQDFRPATAYVKIPVLYFHGQRDWMTGPEHFRGAQFPNMLLWSSDVAHIPFIENKGDLNRAITTYRQKTGF